MTKYHVAWRGVAHRTFTTIERPADVFYFLWTRHRYDVTPGLITLDAAGEVTFPVAVEAEIEAGDMHEAVADFRSRYPHFDMGGDVTVERVPS